jgi:hypothetical protein
MMREDDQRFDLKLIVGRTIGEMNGLHRRLDALEREVVTVQGMMSNKPTRSERYLIGFMTILVVLLGSTGIILFRLWATGRILF